MSILPLITGPTGPSFSKAQPQTLQRFLGLLHFPASTCRLTVPHTNLSLKGITMN